MSLTLLQKRRPAAKQMRFYTINGTRTLFGPWALIRKWGRIGQSGTVRETWLEDRNETEQARGLLIRQKEKKAYVPAG
ncbi:MAG: WGR domain-containing protein [Pseudomonadota bacterium]|nr:WGR domain-containing protein [Pseudomonadota bacterium]